MKIKEALLNYSNIEIDLLLAFVLKKNREFLYLNPKKKLSAKQLISLSALVKRRQKGEPIAYILGYKDFCGLRFKVNKNVLIPRPETEIMVERVVQALGLYLLDNKEKQANESSRRSKPEKFTILDVGTGSGCIIISLKNLLWKKYANEQKFRFMASDVSAQALKVARSNAGVYSHTSTYQSSKIRFVRSDLLKDVKGEFDVIVANLPYGWQAWKNNSSASAVGLKFEPRTALFTKEKGLKLIREFLEQISKLKHQPKSVYLEFDPRQKTMLEKLIKKYLPLRQIKFYKDLSGFWRFVEVV